MEVERRALWRPFLVVRSRRYKHGMGNVVELRTKPCGECKAAAGEPHKDECSRSAKRMAELTRRRLEMGKTDPSKLGGRRRTRPLTDDEVRAAALDKAADVLVPAKVKALAELEKLLESKDPSDRKFAVKLILEYTEGKPSQTIVERQDGPRIIEYRTAALPPSEFVPEALDEAVS